MSFSFLHFQVQLGFLIAISPRPGQREHTYTKSAQLPGKPIPSPPTHFDGVPQNVDNYPHLERQYLIRAQWAIETLEATLNGHSLRDPPRTRADDSPEAWTVEFNGHSQENQADQCEWIGVKLTSPKFEAGSPTLQKQLKKVLPILNKQYLTVPNSETRLKVVVHLHNYHYNLHQMKAIAAFIWMLDPLLSDVHPDHCGPNSIFSLGLQYSNLVRDTPLHLKAQLDSAVEISDPWNDHLSPNRRPLKLLSHPGELRETKYDHCVDKLLSADSIHDLIRLISVSIQDIRDYPQASSAYNFQPPGTSNKMAIWFNQHCGTLDFAEIDHWTTLCVGIIRFSLGKTAKSLCQMYPRLRCSSTIFPFLDENGLNGLADYYKTKLETSKVPDLEHWSSDDMPFCRLTDSRSSSDDSSDDSLTLLPHANSPFQVYEKGFSSINGRYSFGIELELYIVVRPSVFSQLKARPPPPGLLIDIGNTEIGAPNCSSPSSWPDPSPEDDRQVGATSFTDRADQIAEVITRQGQLALRRVQMPQDTPDWRQQLAEHGIVPIPGIEPEYQTWTVMRDGSLKTWAGWGGYKEVDGVEIVSPVLGDTPTGWEKVVDVLSILRNNFRLLVTHSCGFHIHVAKGTEMLPFHLLRKVCVLVACAENMIFSLCHPERRESLWSMHILGKGSPLHDGYAESWARRGVSDEFWQHVPRTTSNPRIVGALKRIWLAEKVSRLQQYLIPTASMGKCCISLSKCTPDPQDGTQYKGTVEFRLLEGTLDPELIIRWGQLMTALFRFADLAPLEAWPVFLATVLQCQPSGGCDVNILRVFLTFLGLEGDFDFWADRARTMSKLDEERKSKLPLRNNSRAERPDEAKGFLSRIDKSQVIALRDNLCRRERTLPCLSKRKAAVEEPESPVEPQDRARSILKKAGFGGESVERALKIAIKKSVGSPAGPAEQPVEEAQEDEMDELSIQLLRILHASRSEAEKDLKRHRLA